MGRYANFNTGFEYKFAFGIQPSQDIEKFGGTPSDEYDEQSNSTEHEWTQEDIPLIEKKLSYMKEKYKITHPDINLKTFPLQGMEKAPFGSRFPLTEEGTRSLCRDYKSFVSNICDQKKLCKYILGCLIYHQLLYTNHLTVYYEVY
jgi:hypothetical protein